MQLVDITPIRAMIQSAPAIVNAAETQSREAFPSMVMDRMMPAPLAKSQTPAAAIGATALAIDPSIFANRVTEGEDRFAVQMASRGYGSPAPR